MSKKTQTVTISGTGKTPTTIKMPVNCRVAQVSWDPTGKVDEVSFQFGESDHEFEVSEGEAETQRVVGFVVQAPEEVDEEDLEDE